ncbi:hypothetical protein [Peteryoungia ipomoeae]|uniref:Uncharacterized protein n=1 Tax=Peteryoungia ipomoeae TaxID=1210932 RepID=A0A4S8P190_9HYPH|nr:hypothetical protein [Peteryoungia ipomoeae]THV22995.1 hypothetical protein FAA97_10200 [Peteryoungia ipomoeae]
MTITADTTTETPFETTARPAKLSPQQRAAATEAAAWEAIEAEQSARIRKTEALKALRLEREAREAENAPAPKKKPPVKKVVKRG